MRFVRHTLRLVVREPRRSVAALVGVAIASALITSVLLFGMASGTTVTRRALADVPVDAQVVLGTGADPGAASAIVQSDPAVRTVSAFELATPTCSPEQDSGRPAAARRQSPTAPTIPPRSRLSSWRRPVKPPSLGGANRDGGDEDREV